MNATLPSQSSPQKVIKLIISGNTKVSTPLSLVSSTTSFTMAATTGSLQQISMTKQPQATTTTTTTTTAVVVPTTAGYHQQLPHSNSSLLLKSRSNSQPNALELKLPSNYAASPTKKSPNKKQNDLSENVPSSTLEKSQLKLISRKQHPSHKLTACTQEMIPSHFIPLAMPGSRPSTATSAAVATSAISSMPANTTAASTAATIASYRIINNLILHTSRMNQQKLQQSQLLQHVQQSHLPEAQPQSKLSESQSPQQEQHQATNCSKRPSSSGNMGQLGMTVPVSSILIEQKFPQQQQQQLLQSPIKSSHLHTISEAEKVRVQTFNQISNLLDFQKARASQQSTIGVVNSKPKLESNLYTPAQSSFKLDENYSDTNFSCTRNRNRHNRKTDSLSSSLSSRKSSRTPRPLKVFIRQPSNMSSNNNNSNFNNKQTTQQQLTQSQQQLQNQAKQNNNNNNIISQEQQQYQSAVQKVYSEIIPSNRTSSRSFNPINRILSKKSYQLSQSQQQQQQKQQSSQQKYVCSHAVTPENQTESCNCCCCNPSPSSPSCSGSCNPTTESHLISKQKTKQVLVIAPNRNSIKSTSSTAVTFRSAAEVLRLDSQKYLLSNSSASSQQSTRSLMFDSTEDVPEENRSSNNNIASSNDLCTGESTNLLMIESENYASNNNRCLADDIDALNPVEDMQLGRGSDISENQKRQLRRCSAAAASASSSVEKGQSTIVSNFSLTKSFTSEVIGHFRLAKKIPDSPAAGMSSSTCNHKQKTNKLNLNQSLPSGLKQEQNQISSPSRSIVSRKNSSSIHQQRNQQQLNSRNSSQYSRAAYYNNNNNNNMSIEGEGLRSRSCSSRRLMQQQSCTAPLMVTAVSAELNIMESRLPLSQQQFVQQHSCNGEDSGVIGSTASNSCKYFSNKNHPKKRGSQRESTPNGGSHSNSNTASSSNLTSSSAGKIQNYINQIANAVPVKDIWEGYSPWVQNANPIEDDIDIVDSTVEN